MTAAVALELNVEGGRVRVPKGAFSLEGFRAWVTSPSFREEKARATFAGGEVHVDMSPESIESHNKVKVAITADVVSFVRARDLGEVYADGVLLTNPKAALSTEPDLCFASWATLAKGRVTLTPRQTRGGEFAELVGAPDLVVEIVSDASVDKDLRVLRAAYARAGIAEYWIIDARAATLKFDLLRLSGRSYRPSATRRSLALGATVALTRTRNRAGRWTYALGLA